jgi:hypothetical protein
MAALGPGPSPTDPMLWCKLLDTDDHPALHRQWYRTAPPNRSALAPERRDHGGGFCHDCPATTRRLT